jgi:flavin-dependent dehydrogenase
MPDNPLLTTHDTFDVIVIGCGPAGCSAAVTCHQAGLHVLIITQAVQHQDEDLESLSPLESIHPGVQSLLEKINAAGAITASCCGTYKGIYAGSNFTPLGEDENGPWEGHHLHRKKFDAALLQHVIALGISIRFGETVHDFILEQENIIGIRSTSGDYLASFIIDASGKKSIAGKKLNLQQVFYSPPLLCWTGVSGNIIDFPFDHQAAHFIPGNQGWHWLAPLPPNRCAWTQLSIRGEKSIEPPDTLKDFPVVSEIEFGNMRWRRYQPVCREGLLLCGDAAGILDPAAGQGIFNALLSGNIAAQCIVICSSQPQYKAFHLARYNDWFVQYFEQKAEQLKDYYVANGLSVLLQSS